MPPSILEPLEVSNGAKFKVEIIPEPVCVLSYFFSREKKHILSNTGAPSLVFHCGMDDRFTVSRVNPGMTSYVFESTTDLTQDYYQHWPSCKRIVSRCTVESCRNRGVQPSRHINNIPGDTTASVRKLSGNFGRRSGNDQHKTSEGTVRSILFTVNYKNKKANEL